MELSRKSLTDLKIIARQLGAKKPVGKLRARQTWEAAIINQAEKMELSIEAAINPILRTYCLGGRNGYPTETIEAAVELIEKHCYPNLFRKRQLIENPEALELAAKVLPGILRGTN